MKFNLGILLLFVAFLTAFPSGSARACNNAEGNEIASSQLLDEHCAVEQDACTQTHPGQECPPDTDGCGHCHCPGCGASGITPGSFVQMEPIGMTHIPVFFKKRAAHFDYQAPDTSAHLAALFRPPIFFTA